MLPFAARRQQLPLKQGGAFNLEAYLASLPAAAYWDFTKTDRHFVAAQGPTLASNNGDLIGLAMDSASWARRTLEQQIAQASDLLGGAGSFSSATGWLVDGSTGVSGGKLNLTNSGFATYSGASLVQNAWYRCTFTIESLTLGSASGISMRPGNNPGAVYTTPGTYTDYIQFTGTTGAVDISIVSRGGFPVGAAVIDNFTVVPVTGFHGIQGTGSLKPARQTTGAKFDGSDDNLLTAYLAGSSNNFLAGLLTIPATIASTQVIAGLQDATPSGLSLSVSTNGLIGGRVGTSSLTGSGTSDQRGNRVPVAITGDGSSWRLFVGTAQENQGSASGMSTSVALRLGSLNNNGSASAFFGGSIERFIAGRDYLDLSRWLQIRSALLAA